MPAIIGSAAAGCQSGRSAARRVAGSESWAVPGGWPILLAEETMFRTVAVLLLLLGLATATPVVCLCAPPLASYTFAYASHETQPAPPAGAVQHEGRLPANTGQSGRAAPPADGGVSLVAAGTLPRLASADPVADSASLISASAAAAVASIVATAAGLPSSAPWRLPRPGVVARLRQTLPTTPRGLSWSTAVPPPR
jgi:hypothetical protein